VVWLFELMMLSREKRFDVSCASNPLGYSSDLIDFGMACHLIQALQRFDHEAIYLSRYVDTNFHFSIGFQ
jgi:hypothetical protein